MKLEAGKFYRTRDGRKAYVAAVGCPLNACEVNLVLGWIESDDDDGNEAAPYSWSQDGRYYKESASCNDLIAPWIDPPWDYTPKRGEWVWSHNGSDYYPWFINCPDVDVKHLLEHGYLFARMDQPPPPPGGSNA